MGLIDQIALIGTPDQCRRRLEEYRRAGVTQPLIVPRVSGPDAKVHAMEAIRACAPK